MGCYRPRFIHHQSARSSLSEGPWPQHGRDCRSDDRVRSGHNMGPNTMTTAEAPAPQSTSVELPVIAPGQELVRLPRLAECEPIKRSLRWRLIGSSVLGA